MPDYDSQPDISQIDESAEVLSQDNMSSSSMAKQAESLYKQFGAKTIEIKDLFKDEREKVIKKDENKQTEE